METITCLLEAFTISLYMCLMYETKSQLRTNGRPLLVTNLYEYIAAMTI